MTWVIMIFVLIVAAVVQTLLPGHVLLGQAKFPLLLAVVLYYALNRETSTMAAAAFLAGLLQDALSPIPLGYSAFCFCVVGWGAGRFRDLVITESLITQVFFGAVAGVIVTVILYLLLLQGGLVACSASWVVLKAVGTGVLSMLCTPVMFRVTNELDRLVGNVRIGAEVEKEQ